MIGLPCRVVGSFEMDKGVLMGKRTVEELLAAIKNMDYSERMQIVRAIEEEFSITVQTDTESECVLIAPSYEIVLKGYNNSYKNKAELIKLIRLLSNRGLKEAKMLLEDGAFPVTICKVYREASRSEVEREAHVIMEELRALGAEVDMNFDYGNYVD